MPVTGMAPDKGPFDVRAGKARIDIRIFRYIIIVVKIDKFMIFYRPIADKSCRRQYKADQYDTNISGSVFQWFSINVMTETL
jgi:hypothetical protein